MTVFIVDVEADGPAPGLYSMVSFGAVVLDSALDKTFYGTSAPISDFWIPDALAVSNITRQQHLEYPSPEIAIRNFHDWVKMNTRGSAILMSDNNSFDASFINYYMHKYIGNNVFGFSSRRIGDFYAGLTKDFRNTGRWKDFRKTKHTHNPVDDAVGNAEALVEICRRFNVKLTNI